MAVFQGKKRESWGEYLANLPSMFVRSIFRHNYPNNDVDRSEIVFKNFFLHFHPVKCHKHSLDPFYTLGLGSYHNELVFAAYLHRRHSDVLLYPCRRPGL